MNNNTVTSVSGLIFNKFQKATLASMFSLNFSDKPIWRSTFLLHSGRALGFCGLQHYKKNCRLLDFPKKLLR